MSGLQFILLPNVLTNPHFVQSHRRDTVPRDPEVQTRHPPFFDIPLYTTAARGAVYVNFHWLSVSVCPTCFFASSDPDYFLQPANRRAQVHEMHPLALQHVVDGWAARQALARDLSPTFFTDHRTLADALRSYELAIASSETLYGANPHTFAIELSRIGNYHLRLGLLQEEAKAAPEVVAGAYQKALEVFQKAYVYLQGPVFYRNVYQIIALAIYFSDDTTAYKYLARMKELGHAGGAAAEVSAQGRPTLGRYLALAEKAWEDREYHRWGGA